MTPRAQIRFVWLALREGCRVIRRSPAVWLTAAGLPWLFAKLPWPGVPSDMHLRNPTVWVWYFWGSMAFLALLEISIAVAWWVRLVSAGSIASPREVLGAVVRRSGGALILSLGFLFWNVAWNGWSSFLFLKAMHSPSSGWDWLVLWHPMILFYFGRFIFWALVPALLTADGFFESLTTAVRFSRRHFLPVLVLMAVGAAWEWLLFPFLKGPIHLWGQPWFENPLHRIKAFSSAVYYAAQGYFDIVQFLSVWLVWENEEVAGASPAPTEERSEI